MHRALFQSIAVLALALPASVAAHGGASPSLVVTVDHVDPGTSLAIVASDFGSDAVVDFSLAAGSRTTELGRTTAGPDGHFQAEFEVPANFAHGWAELQATGDDGTYATTQVLVGPASEAPPRPGRQATWWLDPSIWLLAAFILGAVAILAWLGFRSKPARRR